MPEQLYAVAKRQRSGKFKGLTSLNRTFQEINIEAFVDMGLRPIAPPKGFPNVYGARLAHRPLETFGRKYFVLFLKYRFCQLGSPR